ncbi:MAG: energy-coupling factor transporter transmembrane protein EcfT, partial [Lachnospiraceae bacterium]|nr:energy-coupling factor transporter transmembrane protein EcfT [Lachnospiraceae bacterium]MCR5638628.1 energy-coupling factor transporter transmembrane protein EcfT [Lachnospiraceae bacterium]
VPKKVTIPISSMFRFFPTIKEEYSAIKDAMTLRGVGAWSNPLEMLEFRLVPLMTELLSINNELAASALTRGLDAPNKRENVCPIGFHIQDYLVVLLCVGIVVLKILCNIYGW